MNFEYYKQSLSLANDTKFIKIEHQEAMVADVYKIIQPHEPTFILKICQESNLLNEIYFLEFLDKKIPVPKIIAKVLPDDLNKGAILMQYLTGEILTVNAISKNIANKLGEYLALIHQNKTTGFGNVSADSKLTFDIKLMLTNKLEEEIAECEIHLPNEIIKKSKDYFYKNLDLIKKVDGPCLIHRDFRPGNIIIENDKVKGIIDWSSARASFAEEDFCSIEHGEWGDFNGFKNDFLKGYSNNRKIPDYEILMPLLRLKRAIAVIGFTVKRGTWNNKDKKPYQFNLNILKSFNF